MLRELDVPGGANVGLIDLVARYALGHGCNVTVEGILRADHYAEMLGALIAGHLGQTRCYHFDVPFDETVRRIMADSGLAAETVQSRRLASRVSGTTPVRPEPGVELCVRGLSAQQGDDASLGGLFGGDGGAFGRRRDTGAPVEDD